MAQVLIRDYVRLLRPMQWYKNLLIFLPIFFSGLIMEPEPLLVTIIGFFSLSLMSSVNYIINDVADKKKDSLNPEKKNRPIASGNINPRSALVLALTLFVLSLSISIYLAFEFFLLLIIFFLLTFIYTLWLKDEAVIDVILISTNFVLRAVGGALVIDVFISGWLIAGTFALAFFLAVSKRFSELKMLGKKASGHRKVYGSYNQDMLKSMLVVSSSVLIFSYFMFTLFSEHSWLFLSIPFAIYPILRFYYLIDSGNPIPRHLELFYKDKRLLFGIIITCLVIFFILYHGLFF